MPVPPEQAACWTHRGGRRTNQDAALAVSLADGRELVAVADGMGGHYGGAVASRMALETVVEALQRGESLAQAVRSANTAVHGAQAANPEWQGMGTTLVAALRDGNRYEVVNVGDSRGYRVGAHGMEQVTRDHSFLAEAMERSDAEAEEARRSPWRHAVTRAIGLDPTVDVDTFGPFDVTEAHYLLLCSDGLSNTLEHPALQRFFANDPDAATVAERLGNAAVTAGASDNVTAAVLRLQPRRTLVPWGPHTGPAVTGSLERPRPAAAQSIWRWRIREAAIVLAAVLLLVVFQLLLRTMM